MLDVGGNCSIALFLRRSFAGSRGSVYCLRGGEAIRGAGPCGPCAGPAVPRTSHAALAAPRGSIPSGSDDPIVWRGSMRVLEEAGERVYIIESRGKSSVGRAC